jgi:hypothetical protein
MVRPGGWVQLELSDMPFALRMARIAKGRFLRAAIQETQLLIMIPRSEVQKETNRGVEFPGNQKAHSAMERHLAMVYKNHTAGCLPWQSGTAMNPQTRWSWRGTAGPLPEAAARLPGWPTPPGTPPAPPGDAEGDESYEIEGMPSSSVYMHSPLPKTEFFNHNAFAKDSNHNKDFIPDLLSTESAVWQYCCH